MKFEDYLKAYRQEHQTLGCRITHMFGIPMLVASALVIPFDVALSLAMLTVGVILQMIGHNVFEKNKPVLTNDPFNPMIYLVSFQFVAEEWLALLK